MVRSISDDEDVRVFAVDVKTVGCSPDSFSVTDDGVEVGSIILMELLDNLAPVEGRMGLLKVIADFLFIDGWRLSVGEEESLSIETGLSWGFRGHEIEGNDS